MKQNKLLLGLLSAGIVTGSIPLLSLTGCSCSNPQPVSELDVDDSFVYRTQNGYVDSSDPKQGACYVAGFKLAEGQKISDLSVKITDLQGIDDAVATAEIDEIESNFFTVDVYFVSKNVLSDKTAQFNIVLTDKNNKTKQFNDFEVSSFNNVIGIEFEGNHQQTIATLTDGKNYEYVIKGTFKEHLYDILTSETQVQIKDVNTKQPISGVTAEIIDKEKQDFYVKLKFDDVLSKHPNEFYLEFTNADYPDWSSQTRFTLDVITDANKIFQCDCIPAFGTAILKKCICTDKEIVVPDYSSDENGTEYPITNIYYQAFHYCKSVESITLGDKVTTIDNTAIEYCSSLKKIAIGKNAEIDFNFNNAVFYRCNKLETITIDSENTKIKSEDSNCIIDIKTNALIKASNSTTQIPDGVTQISTQAFADLDLIKTITIPDSIQTIHSWAFAECKSLKSVVFSGTQQITEIPNGAFIGCISLQTINLPTTVTTIGIQAFANCSSLTSFNLTDNLTSIGSNCFYNCANLSGAIIIPSNVTYLGINPFAGCNSLTSLQVANDNTTYFSKDGTTECNCIFTTPTEDTKYIISGLAKNLIIPSNSIIGPSAFAYSNIESFDFSNVISIGEEAFLQCSSLKTITNLDNLYYIGAGAFDKCTSLQEVDLRNNSYITQIPYYCFARCSSLITIKLSNFITSIDESAFARCSALKSINIPNSVEYLGSDCFGYCSSLKEITFAENSNLKKIHGSFFECWSLESISIPDSVETISEGTFSRCYSLTTITFGENSHLFYIGPIAFYLCICLESITIPKTITSIGLGAFSSCISLQTAIFKDTNNWWYDTGTAISADTLKDTSKAAEVLLLGLGLTHNIY